MHATATAGWRSPYHCTALGKACLSVWDRSMRQTIIDSCGLPEKTNNTITNVDDLNAQLEIYRVKGYAVDKEENEIGVSGVASVIKDGLGDVCAAVSVSGPSNRLVKPTIDRIGPMVSDTANRISLLMGFGGIKLRHHDKI